MRSPKKEFLMQRRNDKAISSGNVKGAQKPKASKMEKVDQSLGEIRFLFNDSIPRQLVQMARTQEAAWKCV